VISTAKPPDGRDPRNTPTTIERAGSNAGGFCPGLCCFQSAAHSALVRTTTSRRSSMPLRSPRWTVAIFIWAALAA
jgi:hypothetical protein